MAFFGFFFLPLLCSPLLSELSDPKRQVPQIQGKMDRSGLSSHQALTTRNQKGVFPSEIPELGRSHGDIHSSQKDQ